MSDPRYRSSFGFIDLLFNLLVGFVFLFMLAFMLINPVAKKETIKPKAEYFFQHMSQEWMSGYNEMKNRHYEIEAYALKIFSICYHDTFQRLCRKLFS